MSQSETPSFHQILIKPVTGTVLAVLSGLSFFFLCMILPLVGPAGSVVDHATKNKLAFGTVLLITLAFAGLSSYSKLERRKEDQSPLPFFSLGLTLLCILTFVVFVFGGLAI